MKWDHTKAGEAYREGKNWARSRGMKKAYASGNRAKATCCICGDLIYNRMMYKDHAPNFEGERKSEYAHTTCSRKDQDDHIKANEFMGYSWERCW